MHEGIAITVEVDITHEPKAGALRNQDCYFIIRACTSKHTFLDKLEFYESFTSGR